MTDDDSDNEEPEHHFERGLSEDTDVYDDSGGWARDTVDLVSDLERVPDQTALSDNPTPPPDTRGTPDPVESMRDESSNAPSLLTLSGSRTGEIVRLESESTLLGRRREDVDIWFDDAAVSRRHALIERMSGESYRIRDLNSSNGTYVNRRRVQGWRELEDGDKIVLSRSAILKFTVPDSLEVEFHEQMYESSVRDGLTAAYSRTFLEEQMRSDMALHERNSGMESALVLLDIDHFKEVNDTYGHAAGDAVLRAFSERVRGATRSGDIFARYGGEEFAVLLRDTDTDALESICERFRSTVADEAFEFDEGSVELTISLGATIYRGESLDSIEDWFRAVDRALYKAKEAGRDRVCIANE